MTAVAQSDPLFFDRRPGLALLFIVAVLVALFAATVSLPDDRYVRFQKLEQTVVGRSRWDYERIHFDKTPIDVAVVGDSRTEAAISAPLLGAALSREAGRPVRVANLSIPQTGRNLDYVIAKELLLNRPEVRILLLAVADPMYWSQPAFKQLADSGDVVRSPIYVNWSYLDDLFYQPYRHLDLFVNSLAPSLFGFSHAFDSRHYQGTNYDTAFPFYEPDGHFIDRDKHLSAAELDRLAAKNPPAKGGFSRRLFGEHEDVINHVFTRRIAQLAAENHTTLLFLHVPKWRGHAPEFDAAPVSRVAPILFAPDSNTEDPDNFIDDHHASVRGARKVDAWLASALKPYLGAFTRETGQSKVATR